MAPTLTRTGLLLLLPLLALPLRALGDDGRKKERTDQHGDPLPRGAIARLGTVRFRPGSSVHSVAFAPNGKLLASGGGDGFIHFWDPATGKQLRRFTARPDIVNSSAWVESIAFSPDGNTLAAA